MTRGIAEIARLGMKMGGKYQTFAGLSGVGDLFVTCSSRHGNSVFNTFAKVSNVASSIPFATLTILCP